jgi:hypothetical protein
MVHYMPWYVAKPFSGAWGWHWTMSHYDPDRLNANGERQIASWYYPLIGPYDSADPAVLEYHVLLMKLAGIDGAIVDWYGVDDVNDYAVNNQRTLALLNYCRKAGLKFSLCYEDQVFHQETNSGFVAAGAAITHAKQALLYAQANFFCDPNFLRLSNAPVFFDFGPQYFKDDADWVSIFSVLQETNHPVFFTEDNRLPVAAGAFNWPPMWMSGGGAGTLTCAQLQSYLADFDQKAAGWPNFVSSAFARFHDIYAQAGVAPSYGSLEDANGGTLTNTLARAMTNASALVHLVTWNDYGEGTVLEPTREFGYRDLGIIQDLRRQYLDAGFPYHTNDLAMAYRLYALRKHYANNVTVGAELDRIFTNIVSGAISTAEWQLAGLESSRPVIYDISHDGAQVRFSIGGYLASGMAIQASADLASWQTLQSFPATTNLPVFSANTDQAVCRFFRVQ